MVDGCVSSLVDGGVSSFDADVSLVADSVVPSVAASKSCSVSSRQMTLNGSEVDDSPTRALPSLPKVKSMTSHMNCQI